MKLCMRIASAITVGSLALAPVTATQAQARPAAAEIIAKYVAAIGGEAEIRKVTSYKQSGTLEIASMGLSATMEVAAAAPNKMSTKTSIPGIGDIESGYDGKHAWNTVPMQGPRLLEGKELENVVESADFYANLLYPADRFLSMETVGDTTIAGEKAYVVKMVRKATKAESRTYFSATSGLLLGGVSSQETQMGPMEMKQLVSGYKKFGALMMPTKLEQEAGPQKLVMNISNIVINGAPAEAFEPPAPVKALIKP